jgi:hypothetical protein
MVESVDDLHSIFINILSSILWLPLGALLAYIVFYFQVRHPRRRLWHLHDPGDLVICAANSTTTDTGVYQRPATGIGQVRAIALAIESLGSFIVRTTCWRRCAARQSSA